MHYMKMLNFWFHTSYLTFENNNKISIYLSNGSKVELHLVKHVEVNNVDNITVELEKRRTEVINAKLKMMQKN